MFAYARTEGQRVMRLAGMPACPKRWNTTLRINEISETNEKHDSRNGLQPSEAPG